MRELPNYEENIRQKIVALKTPRSPTVMTRMSGMVENLRREIKSAAPDKPVTPAAPNEIKPVPGRNETDRSRRRGSLRATSSTPVLRPLGIAGIVLVFVVAMLFQREDLRDRFIKLVSAGKLNVATQAVDDAASRVSRYLGMQLVVNALYGVPIGIGALLHRHSERPALGAARDAAAVHPVRRPVDRGRVSRSRSPLAVDPGWTMFFYTLALFVVMELISNNLIEVVLYGASTGISNLALLVAAVFWTWLWGPAGLVLSTPITVCVLVLGNYVPGLSYLSMLLGSEPVLEPPAQFYQRMLSMESEDMLDLAVKHIAEHSLAGILRGCVRAGAVAVGTGSTQRRVARSPAALHFPVEPRIDRGARAPGRTGAARGARADEPTRSSRNRPRCRRVPLVLGVPARDEADEIVAYMLAHLLRRRGITAAVTPLAVPIDEAFKAADRSEVRMAFISALPPSAVGAARQMCRRLARPLAGTLRCWWACGAIAPASKNWKNGCTPASPMKSSPRSPTRWSRSKRWSLETQNSRQPSPASRRWQQLRAAGSPARRPSPRRRAKSRSAAGF